MVRANSAKMEPRIITVLEESIRVALRIARSARRHCTMPKTATIPPSTIAKMPKTVTRSRAPATSTNWSRATPPAMSASAVRIHAKKVRSLASKKR